MDLKLSGGVASAAERTTIDAHVAAHGTAAINCCRSSTPSTTASGG